MEWKGIMPAITTCFDRHLKVDFSFIQDHCSWLVDNGCTGIVPLGSLGEGATLAFDEKIAIVETCIKAVGSRVPVVAAVSSLSTREAVDLAQALTHVGCQGLMVLPPYVYVGDWRETKAHVSAVLKASPLPFMLYNNPVAYGTDFLPEHIQELAREHENLAAVKESSTDVRRITSIRALLGDRVSVFVGVDDEVVEGVAMGAVGWIAGLANALPRESVALFDLTTNGDSQKAFELYRWFLPLLRMDTGPKFVQLIKLVQQESGMGSARVRPPRLELAGEELESALGIIRRALANRPDYCRTPARQASYAR
jgi:dihydrodipicolinate synthase/N-acetylneuraminate lyase